MRAKCGCSSQYPTRATKFVWWTLRRSSTYAPNTPYKRIHQVMFEYERTNSTFLVDYYVFNIVAQTYLCFELLIALRWWAGEHFNSHLLSIIQISMIDNSKPSFTNNPFEVICHQLYLGVWYPSHFTFKRQISPCRLYSFQNTQKSTHNCWLVSFILHSCFVTTNTTYLLYLMAFSLWIQQWQQKQLKK